MNRIALHTLGCKLNYAETASIGKQFANNGYKIVGIDDPADIIIINSCSVTSEADRECRQIIRRAARHSPDAFIAVVGCYAQLQPEQIAQINGIDLVLGTRDKNSLFNLIQKGYRKKAKPEIIISCIDTAGFEEASSAGFEDRTRTFLKIQDGCDYQCAYCTVPLARGKSRSASVETLIHQANEAVELGYREIVLTGVNVGDYGRNNSTDLLGLLKELVKTDGLSRIRISSIEPNLLSDELLDFWFTNKILCNHWHIPLQSGSDTVLKKMQRRYLTSAYAERIEKIKTNVPAACIGSDIIVGFPGESDSLFGETFSFLNDIPLSYFHIFHYSERKNTRAAELENKIDPRVKAERTERLRSLGLQKREIYHKMFVGKTVSVLFESEHADGTQSGLSEEYIRVEAQSKLNMTNKIADVKIEKALCDRCTGKIAGSEKITAVNTAF